jgi:hypothetical protein
VSSGIRRAAAMALLIVSGCGDALPGSGEPRRLGGSFYILVSLGGWDTPRDGEAPGLRDGVDPRTVVTHAVVNEGIEKLPATTHARYEVNGAAFRRVKVSDDGGAWRLGGTLAPTYLPPSGEPFRLVLQTTEEHAISTTMAMPEYTTMLSPRRGAEVSLRQDLVVSWLDTRGDAVDVVGLRASTFGAPQEAGVAPEGSVEAAPGATKITLTAADLDDWYRRYLSSDEATAAGIAAGAPVNAEVMLSRHRTTSSAGPFLFGESVITVEVASASVVLVP